MATFEIHRSNIPGNMSPMLLEHYAQAFRTLYCNDHISGEKTKPDLDIIIKGEWPNYDRDGIYLIHNAGAKIVEIGRKYVTIELSQVDSKGRPERCKVELTPAPGEGFTRILFITNHHVKGMEFPK